MMDVTTSVVTTGVLATAGRWANGESLDIKFFIGVGFYALTMAVFSSANANLAGAFAVLVLLLALFKYLPPIISKLGLS